MNPNKFVSECQRTSAPITAEVTDRFCGDEAMTELMDRMNEILSCAHDLDGLKKHIYYGKEADYSPNLGPVSTLLRISDKNFIKATHGAIGIATELGEVWDIIRTYAYGQDTSLDTSHLKEELGDVLWYVAELVTAIDGDMIDIMEGVVTKLKKRYPEKFTNEDAAERKDKICSECLGKGRVAIDGDAYRCPNCDGTGAIE